MAIKTIGGLIVTRGGLPSCTCCNACNPDETSIDVEMLNFDETIVTYFSMTGSLNHGGYSGGGYVLTWTDGIWTLGQDGYFGESPPRCDPQGIYYINGAGPEDFITLTLSFPP
jgi:hypothetical protein